MAFKAVNFIGNIFWANLSSKQKVAIVTGMNRLGIMFH